MGRCANPQRRNRVSETDYSVRDSTRVRQPVIRLTPHSGVSFSMSLPILPWPMMARVISVRFASAEDRRIELREEFPVERSHRALQILSGDDETYIQPGGALRNHVHVNAF